MFIDWTKNLKDADTKSKFEKKLLSSKPVLERLTQLLDERQEHLDANELSVKSFDNPNWAYKQAFNNGFRSALNIAKKLIDLDQQKETTNEPKPTGLTAGDRSDRPGEGLPPGFNWGRG